MWAAGRSTKKAFNYSRRLQEEADRESLRRLLLAIKAEVETVWSGYELEAGHMVESLKPGEGLALTYRLRQQYFTVYDSNAQYLGHVEDDQLRAAIVRTYTLAKGLIDTHLVNNDLLAQCNRLAGLNQSQYHVLQDQENAERDWKAFGAEVF